MAKGKKGNTRARRVGYELIPRDHVESHPVYSLMGELVREHHEHLRDARIVAAWNLTWQPDADGRVNIENEGWSTPTLQERRAIIYSAEREIAALNELLDTLQKAKNPH